MTSKTQAKREINRRKGSFCKTAYKMAEGSTLTVERAARQIAVNDGTFQLSTKELRSALGGEAVTVHVTPKVTEVKAKTSTKTRATGVGSRGGDPEKAADMVSAEAICDASGIDARGPQGGFTPDFWVVYKAIRAERREATKAA